LNHTALAAFAAHTSPGKSSKPKKKQKAPNNAFCFFIPALRESQTHADRMLKNAEK
jgi:hypothetical protein